MTQSIQLGKYPNPLRHLRFPDWLLLATWILLYLPHLRTSPSWYGDETLTLDIARNLVNAQFAWGPVWNTFGSSYQAGYCGLAGVFAYITGGDILGARFFSALLALGIAGLLWRVGRRVFGGAVGFSAALFFLGYSQTIIHFRQVYPHDGLAFGVTLAFLMVCRRANWRTDLLAGIGLWAAFGSHLLGMYCLPGLGLARFKRPRSWFWIALPSALFFGLFFSLILWRFHGWLWEDVTAAGRFYEADASQHGNQLFRNLWNFFKQDWFHVSGVIGIFLLLGQRRIRRVWPWVLAFAIYSFALLSNRSNLVIFYYQATVLLPFLAVGNAVLWVQLLRWAGRLSVIAARVERAEWKTVRRWVPLVVPVILAATSVSASFSGTLRARNHLWATQSPAEVERVALWLNERTSPDDVVLANTNLAWLLKAKWANLLSFTAWQGYATFMHDYGTPRERFRYSLATDQVKYAVIGDIDQRWTIGQPHVLEVLQKEGVDKWPLVYREENYFILQNPNFGKPKEN